MQYKKLICLLLILANLFMIIPVLPVTAAEETYNYQQAIEKMIEKEVLSAKMEELVPDDHMSRGEFAVMAAKLFRQEGEAADVFSDVKETDSYSGAVNVLNSLGFIPQEMLMEGNFSPDTAILREEAAVILHRAFLYAYEHDGESGVNIKDILAAAPYTQNSIVRMCTMGFMSMENGNFNPKAALTIKEAARAAYELFYTDETYTVKYEPGTYKNDELAQDTIDAYYRGARKVTIQPGTYHLYNASKVAGEAYRPAYFGFYELSDFTVDGTGVTFIGHEPVYSPNDLSIICIHDCESVTVRGFTCDYADVLYTQGEIVEIIEGNTETFYVIDIDEGYSQDFENRDYFASSITITLVDPKTMGYKGGAPNYVVTAREKIEGYERRWLFRQANTTGCKYVQVGDLVSMRMMECLPFAFAARSCSNALIENITVYAGYFGIVVTQSKARETGGECDETTILRNCKVTYGPTPEGATRERVTSTMADGIVAGHRSGKVIVEDCLVEGNTDDAFTATSRTYLIMERGEEPNSFYAGNNGYPETLMVGDTLAIYDQDSNFIGTTKITKVQESGSYTPPTELATVNGNNMTRMRLLTVDDDSLIEPGLFFWNTNVCSKGVVWRNCKAGNNNGRGILVQTCNALIENCTFFSNAKAGVYPVAEKHCVQGPIMNNIVVRNCKFIQCNRKAENNPAGLFRPGGAFSNLIDESGRGNANLLIENCYFEDNYGADILISGTRGATVRNCTFKNRNSYAEGKNYCNKESVRIKNSENVIFEGNISLSDRPMMSYQDVDNLQSDYEPKYVSEWTPSTVNDGTKEWSLGYAPVGKDEYYYYNYRYWKEGDWTKMTPLWSQDTKTNNVYGYLESLYEVRPGSSNDFVATFKAPYTGKIQIGFIEGLRLKENCYNSDGVRVKVVKNENEQIWPQSGWKLIEFERNQSYLDDVLVDVEEGDLLRFRINCNSTQTQDILLFGPEVRYVELDEAVKETAFNELPEKAELSFTDVDAFAWAHHMIAELVEKGIMTGESETVFNPEKEIDRSEFVTMLYRMAGKPAPNRSAAFEDVAENAWYHDAVVWAVENGIVNGVSETRFAPAATITKEQLTAMLYRYAQLRKYDVSETMSLERYTDAWKISPYAQEAVAWGLATGIIKGSSTELLVPYTNPTRAETAHILYKFLNYTE